MDGHETQTRTVLTTLIRNAAGTLPFRRARNTFARVLSGVLLCAVLPVGSALQAQEAPPLAPGDRIRISSPKVVAKQTGRFVSIDGEILVMKLDRTGDTIRVPVAEWPQLERNLGRMDSDEAELKYAGFGFLVGGVTGTLMGYVTGEQSESSGCWSPCTREELMRVFGLVLGITGAVAGFLIAEIAPPDHWERLTLLQGLSVGATAGDRVGLSVTIPR